MFGLRVSIILALGLSGCAYNDHFDNRVGRFDEAASQSRDTMILGNIVRASRAEPLSFFNLGQVSGSNTATATAGLPPLVFGPQAVSAATSGIQSETIFGASAGGGQGFVGNSAQISGVTNFQINPQESKEFYQGLLREVDSQTLELFIHQGLSRELLFYLFTERLIVETGGHKRELRNDPLDREHYPEFQYLVAQAMNFGLRSEAITARGGAGKGKDSGEKGAPPKEKWRLCFDPLLMNGTPLAGNSPICGRPGASVAAGEERTVEFNAKTGARVKLTVLPRSAFAIFQFLGRIVAAGDAGRIQLHSAEAIDTGPLQDDILFDVTSGDESGCFISIADQDRTYCVPRKGAANTKRILGLLAQLIALNTSIAEIPITPTVHVVQ